MPLFYSSVPTVANVLFIAKAEQMQALWSLNLCGLHPHGWSFDGKATPIRTGGKTWEMRAEGAEGVELS